MLCYVKWHMVSCLSVASRGRAEANFKVVLQAVVAGAAVGFVCLGNETFYVRSLISYSLSLCFSNILYGQLDGSLWHSAPQDIFMILLYLSLWHRSSHCFFLGFLSSPVLVWLESSRRCDMSMLARLQRFLVPTGLHPFLLHPDPGGMACASPLSCPL